jgi:threonyl-tRNA synthetase
MKRYLRQRIKNKNDKNNIIRKRGNIMKVIYNDGTVGECSEEEKLHVLRHSAAHIMAQAIQRLYPHADFAYGPATEKGFYYDVDLGDTKLSDEDLLAIEAEMKKIAKENLPFKSFILPRDEAVKLMHDRGNKYKEEHIGDLPDDAVISFYQQGEYIDMCVGPHITYTKALKAFKITQQSGAYWKNDAKNKMLTRINGVAFFTQEELDEYLKQLEEAKARDHRKIGKEMGLFMTDDLVGKGLPMFLPKGYTIWQELENYIKEKERKLGYQHVMTPCVGSVQLYKTSGHWDHYKDNMFPAMQVEDESFVLRPMNCPHHMMIYARRPHSYRELPIRIGEIAHDFRFEASGTLKGIERGRHFCQNDAHLFVTPDQIKDEVSKVVNLIKDVYKDMGITNYRCVLSLRDPEDKVKYHPDDEMWNNAESALREVLKELNIDFTEEIGEAAFYGPKLDVNVTPAVGAEYTLSTCQLDFCLPAKFDLKYTDAESKEHTPVVLHRAILGSLDRFMAYMIEETKGKFPVWLAPLQVKVLPVSEKTFDYAASVYEKIDDAGIRVQLDDRNEKIGYKIREAQMIDRVPYMLIIGAKEAEAGNVSVRNRDTGDTSEMSLDEFVCKVKSDIASRSRNV